MSGIKRKAIHSSGGPDQSTKKQKAIPKKTLKPHAAARDLETATDSDPIVESDSTEHSGDDDGVSWPSDDESKSQQDGDNSPHEGVPLPEISAKKDSKARAPTNESNGLSTSSKEAHAKQKALAQERKAAKPNAESIARTKKLWERLRRKSHVPLEERKKLVAELFDIITGNVKDFVLKHDSVRVVQTAIKYANRDQRRMIAQELKGEYRSLAESRYAKFLLGKLLVHDDKEIRDLIVREFYGHVRRLIKHPEASWILDDIYRGVATPSQKATLLREWYGAEFAIFKAGGKATVTRELKSILEEHPEKRKPIMHALHDLINLLVQKKMTGFTMLHDAMLQYFLNVPAGAAEMTDYIELLKGDEEGDLLKNLAFTKSGAHVVCLALAYGTAKDRKQILKVYKGTIEALAYDANGHQVLLAAYDVIDDTVLTSKSIFPELIGKSSTDLSEPQTQSLLSAAIHLNARIPILYLFVGPSKAILRTEDIELLHSVHQIRNTTSKKDPSTRRAELLTHISPTLLSLIASNAPSLIQSSFGCQFITEVLLSAPAGSDRAPALSAIIHLTHASDPATTRALHEPSAGRMLKSLVQGGRYNPQTKRVDPAPPPALRFHDALHASLEAQGKVLEWATGGNSFVVVGMLEAEGFSAEGALGERLREGKAALEMAAAGATVEEGGGGGGAARKSGREKGNRGAQLLLEKLDEL
ncbi:MAG: hypothetical protein LQ345_005101 [Seirophora villosa]|nr:MAG: hypothetical protein LQ345_005101 [Seirophora villosa]